MPRLNTLYMAKTFQLHPKFWDQTQQLDSDIRKHLLWAADTFLESIKIPFSVKHLYLTGSLASFIWSELSDWDIHIILDLEVKLDTKYVDEYLEAKSTEFNKKHHIIVKGFPVEVNAKTKESKHKDKAIYDLQKDSWLVKPKVPSKTVEDEEVQNIVNKFQDSIEDLIRKNATEEEFAKIKDQIKDLRIKGLKYNGEYSTGNLVFKGLRHNGSLEKLYSHKLQAKDKELSLEQIYKNICPI